MNTGSAASSNGISSNGISNGTVKTKEETYLQDLIESFKLLDDTDDFNRVGRKVIPISATKNEIVCELHVLAEHVNSKGTLHGGLTASLTDIITARAVGLTITDQGMASVELAVSYFLPVKLGDTIIITATILKLGRNIVFTEAEFRRKSDGKLTSKGKHTIALLPNQPGVTGKVIQF